ncbi:amino acid racemase, partial [Candidatus Aminicenantes bacterium AC-335-A11]|nr:amino acid racemase [Candidatus Aminicenantes bacterium AC-335-A11]
MKKIGILGGLGPESTIEYYRIITSLCRKKGMGHNYPVIIIYSVNFQEVNNLLVKENLSAYVDKLVDGINHLRLAGADFALIAANTPHLVFEEIKAKSSIPLISIVEETARIANKNCLRRLGLLGTKFTMEKGFYPAVFSKYGIQITIPNEDERNYIQEKIMKELVDGIIREETRKKFIKIIENLIAKENIDGVILGCTEIPLLISQEMVSIPVLNTTMIHA